MECPREDEPEEEHRIDRERESRISALALRYRSGDLETLGAIYAELAPFIASAIRPHVTESNHLPPDIGPEDLYQQAYVELAEAILDWEPGRRENFLPYFYRSFPWRIDHYLRSKTPARRTSRFQMLSSPHDLLMRQLAANAGSDGRDWDGALAWSELLRSLPVQCLQVVRLHVLDGLSFAEVARVMGIGRSTAHDVFKRAMMLMRSMLE